MSGIIRHFTPNAPRPVNQAGVNKAQADAEARAGALSQQEAAAFQARRNVRRTGGLRLLFSPLRDVAPGDQAAVLQKILGSMGSMGTMG